MPASKSFAIALHAHQPVGNFGWVFDEAYRDCYFPFFEVLKAHPGVKINCHFSGSLLDWLEAERPEFLRMIRRLSERGQIEILGGAYYEPIWGLVPEKDLAGQIRMMSSKLTAFFGNAPDGAWLAERVWDPQIVAPAAQAGILYTVLDDAHLMKCGEKAPVTGYFKAQEKGASLDVFACMQPFRYAIPFRRAEDTLALIRRTPAGAGDVLTFADDLEKFGLWPGTHDHVYRKKWLEHFFTLLERDRSVRTVTFSQFRSEFPPKRAVTVPHGSYSEMMQWAGGRFYNFLDKYSESRFARDRMWQVSRELQELGAPVNGTAEVYERARTALYRAQCNCSYWHGVFGGLYLHHLRSAVFENLMRAERGIRSIREKRGIKNATAVEKLELESGVRYLLHTPELDAYFNPSYGGALEELDFLPKNANLTCTIQRRKECYHEAVFNPAPGVVPNEAIMIYRMLGSRQRSLEKELRFDPDRKLSLLDRFFEHPVSSEELKEARFVERGDFVGSAYEAGAHGGELRLERLGCVQTDGRTHSIRVSKTVSLGPQARLKAKYRLTNEGREPASFVFAVELNFSIGDPEAMRGLDPARGRGWLFRDAWHGLKLAIEASEEFTRLAVPVETISESERGLDRTYQGLAVLLQRPVALLPGSPVEFTFEVAVS